MDKQMLKYQEYRSEAELEQSPTNQAAQGWLDRAKTAARGAGLMGPETPSVFGDLGPMPTPEQAQQSKSNEDTLKLGKGPLKQQAQDAPQMRAATPQEQQAAKAPPTAQEAYDPSQDTATGQVLEHAKSQGAQAISNTYAGLADFYGTLDGLAGIVSRRAGRGKPEVFEYLKQSSEYWAEHYQGKVSLDGYMTRVVGGVLGSGPALVEFAMGPEWAALKGFAQNGEIGDALYGAARRAAAGVVFKGAHRLDAPGRIATGTAYMTGESAVEQLGSTGTLDAGQTAEAAGVGLGMMLSGGLGPGNKAGLRQRMVRPDQWVAFSEVGKEIERARESGLIDERTSDIAYDFYAKDLERGGTALKDTSLAVVDRVNLLRQGVDDWILREQGMAPDPGKQYAVTGKTATRMAEDGTYQTAIELYQGARADTLVEEWMHREYDRMPASERNAVTRAYEAYKAGLPEGGQPMSEAEFYAKGATDKFFADEVAAKKAANRPAWLKAVDAAKSRWDGFVQAVRGVPGAKEDGSAPAMQPGGMSEAYQSAYHGSPYRFDKFTLDHIGSGEGAQAYGWGLYFAGNKEVAEYYRENLSAQRVFVDNRDHFAGMSWLTRQAREFATMALNEAVQRGENDPAKAASDWLSDQAKKSRLDTDKRALYDANNAVLALRGKDFTFTKGQLYEVTIPDDHTMLDWDKPLSEQPEQVKKALGGIKLKTPKSADGFDMGGGAVIRDNRKGQVKPGSVAPWVLVTGDSKFDLTQKDVDRMLGQGLSEMTGQGIYGRLVSEYGSQQAASEYLKSIGIPGLRYLDGTSRGKGEGSHNYVVFDDAQIAIDKTYYQVKDHPAMAGADTNDAAQVAEAQRLWAEMGTESPYFKKWFGDSKVVDAQGKPLVVYHGSNADFEAFDPSSRGKQTANPTSFWGHFFTRNTAEASRYTSDFGKSAGGAVYPVYVSIKNPYVMSYSEFNGLAMTNVNLNAKGGSPRENYYKTIDILKEKLSGIKSAGHDGIIINPGSQFEEIVAFDPTQIKSQFNRGTFDASDPRINYQIKDVDALVYDPTPAPKLDQKYADGGNLNLQRLNTTEDVLKLINDVSRYNRETGVFEQATRGVRTWEQTNEAAQKEGVRLDEMLTRKEGEAANSDKLLAVRQLQAEFAAQTADLMAKAKQTGDPADKDSAVKALGIFMQLTAARDGYAAEAGRALNIMARPVGSGESQLMSKAFADLARKYGGERNADAILDTIWDMTRLSADGKLDIEQLAMFARKVDKASTFDMILEARYIAMLSNPATHIRNTIGNTLAIGMQIPERFAAGLIGKARGLFDEQAKLDRVELGEPAAMLFGAVQGLSAGGRAFLRAARTGESADPLGKIETMRRAITAENMGLDPESAWGKTLDFVAERLRTGSMLLGAEDDFFKAIGYQMELNARAHRTATQEGLRGKEFAERVSELVKNPPWDMQIDALDFSRYTTFTQELGPGMTKLQSALGTDATVALPNGKSIEVPTGKLFRLAVPFFRTPTNIVRYGMERSPLALVMPSVMQSLVDGGAKRDLALARIGMGSTLGFLVASAATSGLVTGNGPSDPKHKESLREVGWQPYSLKVGDKWISYQALEPYSMIIGAAADIALMSDYMEENERNNAVMMVAGAFSNAITSKTFLTGLDDMLNVLSDPERYGDKYAQRFSASWIPSLVKATRRDYDPFVREIWSVTDALKDGIPGLGFRDLYPRRNRYGDPITLGDVWLSHTVDPARKSTIKNAENSETYEIDKVILENHIPIQRPGRMFHHEGVAVELTPEEYDDYQMLPRELGLVESLKNVIATPEFKSASGGPDGIKSHMIREVFGDYREEARWRLVEQSKGIPGGLAERLEFERQDRELKMQQQGGMQ